MISCTHRLLVLEFLKVVLVKTLVVTVQHNYARYVMFFFLSGQTAPSLISTFAIRAFKAV